MAEQVVLAAAVMLRPATAQSAAGSVEKPTPKGGVVIVPEPGAVTL